LQLAEESGLRDRIDAMFHGKKSSAARGSPHTQGRIYRCRR
jgi:hypothetical protein